MFEDLLGRIAVLLTGQSIPYMIIGGQAVLFYGEPRLTKDVDVTLGIEPADSLDFLKFVQGSFLSVLVDQPEQFLKETFVLPCLDEESGIRVDFIFTLSEFEKQAIGRAKTVQIGNQSVQLVSIEDLIILKLIADRPRDIEDVRKILLKQPGLDRAYLKKWMEAYDKELETNLVSRFHEMLKS